MNIEEGGALVSRESFDIASGILIDLEQVTERDDFGRPTHTVYLDGSDSRTFYACCGVDYEIDRDGVRTDYTYDDLKRRTEEKRHGITIKTAYDAAGRVLTVTRIGTDESPVVQQTNDYNLAGELVSSKDALLQTTLHALSGASGRVETTSRPGGGSEVRTSYLDGRTKAVSGSAAAPLEYEYGTWEKGEWTQEIKVGDEGQKTEWMKSYTDLAGRTVKTEHPDGALAQSFYGAAGRLERSVDADGVTQLYGYNARGEQETQAVDVNRNGQIDLAGPDRVSQTAQSVLSVDGIAVRETVQTVFAQQNSATPTTLQTSRSSVSGLEQWNISTRGTETTVKNRLGCGRGRPLGQGSPIRARVKGQKASSARFFQISHSSGACRQPLRAWQGGFDVRSSVGMSPDLLPILKEGRSVQSPIWF